MELGDFKECSYHLTPTPDSVMLDNSDLYDNIINYTDVQLKAIKLYTEHGHELITLYLREGRKFTLNLYILYLEIQKRNKYGDVLRGNFNLQKIDQFYLDLKSCFITTYDRDVIVYRGIPKLLDFKENEMFRSRIFMSTSLKLLTAYKFSLDVNQREPGNTMKIIIPKGTPVCQILDLSLNAFNDEQEILINADSTFICTQPTHKETHIFITENEREPDFNPNVSYKTLENDQVETTAIISMIDFVVLKCDNL